MDCTVSEDIIGLSNMPTAVWLNSDNFPLTTSNDITITTSQNDTDAVATLTFDPLRASHGEGGELYRCSGNLMSLALDSLIEVTRDKLLTVKGKFLIAYLFLTAFILCKHSFYTSCVPGHTPWSPPCWRCRGHHSDMLCPVGPDCGGHTTGHLVLLHLARQSWCGDSVW